MGTTNSPPIALSGTTYTFATLPAGQAINARAFTSDQGWCVFNGFYWAPQPLTAIQRNVEKMRDLVGRAGITNPATAQPLIAPTTWVTATAYNKGQSVTNTGNTGVYTCIVAGASAANPTATTNGPITDGAAQWYYMGPSFTSSPAAPTVTNVVFASRYSAGTSWMNAANTRADAAVVINDDSLFLVSGGPVTPTGQNLSWVFSNTSLSGSASFYTDAPAFQVVTSGGASAPVHSLYINGVPLTLGFGSLNSNGGSINYAQLVFPTRAARLITVELPQTANFHGVITSDTVSKVWAPQVVNSIRMAIHGNSYFDGTAVHPVTQPLGLGQYFGKLCGTLDYWVDALGSGSGWVAQGGNGAFCTGQRLANLIAYNPDVVVISGGGTNDRNVVGITSAQTTAAVQTGLAAVRAALPNTLIFVVGSEAGAIGPSAAIFQQEAAVAAGVAAFGDPYVAFIPQSSTNAAKAWISGTGTTSATNNSGNSDVYISVDGIHPVQAGSNFMATQAANGIINALNTF